jgi:purine-binding chemotaxis protein CheW
MTRRGTPDRSAPNPATWDDLARSVAGGSDVEDRPEDLRQLLTFEVNSTPYAVPVERVREIVRMRPITPIPRVPEEVRGVISLRWEIIEVVDLRRRLDLPPIQPRRSTRIIVVSSETGKVAGILVDAVREVMRVQEETIKATSGGGSTVVEALCTRGDEFVSLIDLDRVLQIDAEY